MNDLPLAIGDPARGHHVVVDFAGWQHDKKPARITDHDDRVWVVLEVLVRATHPDFHPGSPSKVAYGIEADRWYLHVDGPLPGHQGTTGTQDVAIRMFNDGTGYYLLPASHAQVEAAARRSAGQ